VAPSVQREVCYPSGCYYLHGDGVTVAYSWVWVPARRPRPQHPRRPQVRRAAKGRRRRPAGSRVRRLR
jgi:hypothetical protein